MRFLAVLPLLALGACSRSDDRTVPRRISTAQDLAGEKCAVVVGSMMGDLARKYEPRIECEWFNDFNSGVEAVRLGKVAAMPLDRFYARSWVRTAPDDFAATGAFGTIPWGFALRKGSPLCDRVDAALARLKESGRLQAIIEKWSEAEDLDDVRFEPLDYRTDFTGAAGTLRFATPADREPVSFVRADGVVGFDIDVVRTLAYELDMTLELVKVNMGALIELVESGKADLGGGGIAITAERAERVDFSQCYFEMPAVFLVRRDAASAVISRPGDLRGKRVASVVSTALPEVMEAFVPGLEIVSFNDYASALEAVRLGKADAFPADAVVVRSWVAHRPDDFAMGFSFGSCPYGYFAPRGSELLRRINDELVRLKADGTLDRIVRKWCEAADFERVEFEPVPPTSGGKLRFASSCEYEPGAFVSRGRLRGFDIDLCRIIAARMDRELEVVMVNMGSIIPAVQSGKADFGGGCITITESRREQVDFTEPYLDEGYAVIVAKKAASSPLGDIRTPADLKGAHVAHMSSDFHKRELRALQGEIAFEPYSEYAFAFESLRNRKIDAISIGRSYADIWMARFPGEFKVAFEYADDVCAFMLPKGSSLKGPLDEELRRMAASGESAAIARKWIEGAKAGKLPELPHLAASPDGAVEVKVASAAQSEPWCFVSGGELAGIDIEVLMLAASRIGWRLNPKIYSWGGMVDCVNARRCDIANGGVYTAGLEFPTVDASEPYARDRMCILVRDPGFRRDARGLKAALKSLRASFVRTFVTEDRWRMMARGLGITIVITLLSGLLGTLLAFPVWYARTSRFRVVAALAKGYIAILQGTPILVLLMVLFYIIFGQVDIDGLYIAIIGFALNASAYVGEMLRSGIDSVPRGQTEAALSLGYGPKRAFCRFVLPQAVRAVLPVYRGELIGLLKSTSIVGYIAINDLTKASDLVRSRTYESFFPILTTAFVYFVAAYLLALVLERLGRRLDPCWRRAHGRKGGASC